MKRVGLTKLSVVGAGSVGTSLAYAALIRGSVHQVALYDIAAAKVHAEVKDLAHGTQFTPAGEVLGGDDIAVVDDSDVIVITAGAKQKPGQTRLELAHTNVAILKELLPQLLDHAPDAIYVLVTNPVDVLTLAAQRITGLPPGRIFGSGTLLDTSRLRLTVARAAQVSQSNVHAVIMGEHGDSEFPVWSSATIGLTPLREWERDGVAIFDDAMLQECARSVVRAAYEVIEGKGATNYAIGLAGARLVEAIVNDERVILPLSSVLQDYRGISKVAMSVPSLVTRDGIERVLEIPMSISERAQFRASADTLAAICAELEL